MSKIKNALAIAGTTITWGALNAFNKVSAMSAHDAANRAKVGGGFDDSETGDISVDIRSIFNFIFGVMGIVAVIVIILGGFNFMTSTGDPGKVKKGKDTILWGVVGLLVVLFSFAIVNFILNAISGE